MILGRDADPDLGFMARRLALCSRPHTNLGDRPQYVRRNGPYTLYMTATGREKLPYGNQPGPARHEHPQEPQAAATRP